MNYTKEYLSEVRKKLQRGDRKIIAKVAESSPEMVKKVLMGDRNHRKGKGKKIIEVACRIIEVRKILYHIHNSDGAL